MLYNSKSTNNTNSHTLIVTKHINSKIKDFNKIELFKKLNLSMGEEITILGKKAVITKNCGSYIYYTAYKKDGTLGSRESRIWSFDTFTKTVSK